MATETPASLLAFRPAAPPPPDGRALLASAGDHLRAGELQSALDAAYAAIGVYPSGGTDRVVAVLLAVYVLLRGGISSRRWRDVEAAVKSLGHLVPALGLELAGVAVEVNPPEKVAES